MHRHETSTTTDATCGRHRRRPAIRWSLIAAMVVLLAGCADMDAGIAAQDANDGGDAPHLQDHQQAEQHLQNHRVDEALQTYRMVLDNHPDDGDAAAGVAVTELLLMLQLDEVTELLLDHLDAQGAIDPNELLFAREGVLYWASRGVRWADDSDDYEGIRDLVADELPFDDDRLESTIAFVDGLDTPVGQSLRQLVSIANALNVVESHIETALDDPDFRRLYIPGEVFHDEGLDLRIGRSELATIHAAISMARSLVYFVAAYDHDWSLEEAFGQWRTDPPEDRYQPGYEPLDYSVDILDDHLFRSVGSPDRLSASHSSLREAVDWSRDAIRMGLEDQTPTTLQWEDVDEDDAQEIDELLEALAEALDGPTQLPHVFPATTLDLSPMFEGEGRTLDEEISWFVSTELEAANDDEGLGDDLDHWDLNDEALRDFVLEETFDPVPGDDFEVRAGSPNPDEFTELLFGDYWQHVEDVYFATR